MGGGHAGWEHAGCGHVECGMRGVVWGVGMQVPTPNFMYMCSCAGCGTSRGGGHRRRGSRGQRRRVAGGGGTDLRAYIHKSLPNEFAFEHKHSGHIHARMFISCHVGQDDFVWPPAEDLWDCPAPKRARCSPCEVPPPDAGITGASPRCPIPAEAPTAGALAAACAS